MPHDIYIYIYIIKSEASFGGNLHGRNNFLPELYDNDLDGR